MPSSSYVAPHLVDQIALATWEGAPLFEVPLGSRTWVARDTWRTYGPWPAEACAEVLRRWYARGWLELVALADPLPEPAAWRARARPDEHGYVVLADDDARRLLDEPDRWSVESDDGLVMLARTTLGMRQDHCAWVAAGTA